MIKKKKYELFILAIVRFLAIFFEDFKLSYETLLLHDKMALHGEKKKINFLNDFTAKTHKDNIYQIEY